MTARQPHGRGRLLSEPAEGGTSVKGGKQILPGKGEKGTHPRPEKPHLFGGGGGRKRENNKMLHVASSPGERNQTSHSLPAEMESDAARAGFASGRTQKYTSVHREQKQGLGGFTEGDVVRH